MHLFTLLLCRIELLADVAVDILSMISKLWWASSSSTQPFRASNRRLSSSNPCPNAVHRHCFWVTLFNLKCFFSLSLSLESLSRYCCCCWSQTSRNSLWTRQEIFNYVSSLWNWEHCAKVAHTHAFTHTHTHDDVSGTTQIVFSYPMYEYKKNINKSTNYAPAISITNQTSVKNAFDVGLMPSK